MADPNVCPSCQWRKAQPGDEDVSPEPDVCWVDVDYDSNSTERFWDMIECRDRAIKSLRAALAKAERERDEAPETLKRNLIKRAEGHRLAGARFQGADCDESAMLHYRLAFECESIAAAAVALTTKDPQ